MGILARALPRALKNSRWHINNFKSGYGEMVDTPALGAGGRKAVEVQILLPAHTLNPLKNPGF